MKKYDLPLYSQLPNGCGLSTFLMMINPESNVNYKIILGEISNYISTNKNQLKEELKWAYSLSYILLKCIGSNILNAYILKQNESLVHDYMPIIIHEFKEPTLQMENRINSKMLQIFAQTMRTDADLKILFYLFGGAFFPQQQEYPDGTGSLYFTKNDFKNDNRKYEKKIKILWSHLNAKYYNKIPSLTLNRGFHWVAINSINSEYTFTINDPLGGRYEWNVSPRISDSYRFYLFTHDPKNAFILSSQFKKFIISELEKEPWKKK